MMICRSVRIGAAGLVLALGLAGGARAQEAQADVPGPLDSMQDLQDTGKMVFKLADTNNDGQISQKEAVDAANLLVGGFFFRADANGDGTVSQEEGRAAREALFQQKPMLRYLIESGRQQAQAGQGNQPGQPAQGGQGNSNPQSGIRNLANLFDSNNDKQLQAAEVRQAVQSAVQGLFATADTNRDGQMSPTEINAAVAGVARAAVQSTFQAADADNNGQISQQEFERAIVEPSRFVFRVLDGNNDGQISQQEAQGAEQFIRSQLRSLQVPDAPNAPSRVLGSGVAPNAAPAAGQPAPGQPAPGQPAAPR